MKVEDTKLTELEQEFKELVEDNLSKIEEKVAIAARALREAVELSEKFGVPFHSSVSFLDQPYVPSSFNQKFTQLGEEKFDKMCTVGLWQIEDVGCGWQHSDVC